MASCGTHGMEGRTGGYDCEFVDDPHPDDYCAICLLPAQDPQQTRCECAKLYCKPCYDKQKSTSGTCPTCRQALDAFPDRNTSRRIRSLKVKCTSDSCTWVNELRLLEEHLTKCEWVIVPCPNSGCGVMVKRSDVESHHSVCSLETTSCMYMNIGCNITLPRNAMAEHIAASAGCHLGLAMIQLQKQGEETIVKLKEQHQKHVDEIMAQHQKHVDEAMAQHQKLVDEIMTQHQKQLEDIVTQLKKEFQTQIERQTQQCKPTPYADEHVVLKMSSFHQYNDKQWFSPGFYTHSCGYKMCLKVYANGNGSGKGTHVSIFLYLLKGENDDTLMWPMKYKCTVTLLNQINDQHHHSETFTGSEDKMDDSNNRVPAGCTRGSYVYGYSKFFPLDKFDFQKDVQCQYLMDDCLYFRVQVEVLSRPKPWLVQTDLT